MVYELSNPLTADVDLVLDIEYDTATAADITMVEYRVANGIWTDAVFPQTITIPQGDTELVVRVTYAQDHTVEGTETYTLKLDKFPGTTQINNTTSIDTVMTVLDTSV